MRVWATLPHAVGAASVPRATSAFFVPDAVIATWIETRSPETMGVTVIVREPAAAPAVVAFVASAALIAVASPESVGLTPAR